MPAHDDFPWMIAIRPEATERAIAELLHVLWWVSDDQPSLTLLPGTCRAIAPMPDFAFT